MPNNTFSPFAEILTAIGQGRDIQFKSALDGQWVGILASKVLRAIANGSADATFLRVKPDTIRIGAVEVPAPLRVRPLVGQEYSFIRMCVAGTFDWEGGDYDTAHFNQGIFATSDDAAEVLAALNALLAPKD